MYRKGAYEEIIKDFLETENIEIYVKTKYDTYIPFGILGCSLSEFGRKLPSNEIKMMSRLKVFLKRGAMRNMIKDFIAKEIEKAEEARELLEEINEKL